MANISFDDGFETFTINNDPERIIRINPKDTNILARFETAMKRLKEESMAISGIRVQANGSPAESSEISLEESTRQLDSFNQLINRELNYIFNADVATAAFGNQSPVSLVGSEGKFLFEAFLEAALVAVKEKIEETTRQMNDRTGKYTSAYQEAGKHGEKYPFPVK